MTNLTSKTRRKLLTCMSAAALAIAIGTVGMMPSAQAQSGAAAYPNRPIKFIVPYSPGGLGDSFARAVGQDLSERLGQPVIIENMPGASQAIGAAAAAKAPADGYTLFMGTQSGLVLNSIARKKLPYDPVKDFTPISMLFSSPLYLVVHPSVEANSVKELIALAKAKPDFYTVATIGEGTSTHLASVMFETKTGVNLMQVSYKGSAPAITDVLGGRVHMMFEGGASALPYVRQGKLRALASTADERTEKAAPGLPTLAETFPGFSLEVWFGLVAPAGLPKPIVDRLNKEIKEVQKSPKLLELAANLGADVLPSTPEQLGTRIRNELRDYAKVMKDAGIEPQ
ncbi:Bug family tripartite tricarboxylate transporter substrate binding protein [Herbaspirillum sp. GCM10030257]|uniref:Bug family tripartite tricarboxylate transporter substrate binding protein n=1 Tax=Herbaspirillum sp. GCM10030257 TaxID=3273393 RepID=UPI0036132F48